MLRRFTLNGTATRIGDPTFKFLDKDGNVVKRGQRPVTVRVREVSEIDIDYDEYLAEIKDIERQESDLSDAAAKLAQLQADRLKLENEKPV